MKILLLDDQRDLMRIWQDKLKNLGHDVSIASDMGTALRLVSDSTPSFNLLASDLLLKRFEPAFRVEHGLVSDAMANARLGNIPTGQALGLRLWSSQPRTPYCYLSAHTAYWMKNLGHPPEFDGASDRELSQLLLAKERVKLADLGKTLEDVVALWQSKRW